jgi:hypothetical protein
MSNLKENFSDCRVVGFDNTLKNHILREQLDSISDSYKYTPCIMYKEDSANNIAQIVLESYKEGIKNLALIIDPVSQKSLEIDHLKEIGEKLFENFDVLDGQWSLRMRESFDKDFVDKLVDAGINWEDFSKLILVMLGSIVDSKEFETDQKVLAKVREITTDLVKFGKLSPLTKDDAGKIITNYVEVLNSLKETYPELTQDFDQLVQDSETLKNLKAIDGLCKDETTLKQIKKILNKNSKSDMASDLKNTLGEDSINKNFVSQIKAKKGSDGKYHIYLTCVDLPVKGAKGVIAQMGGYLAQGNIVMIPTVSSLNYADTIKSGVPLLPSQSLTLWKKAFNANYATDGKAVPNLLVASIKNIADFSRTIVAIIDQIKKVNKEEQFKVVIHIPAGISVIAPAFKTLSFNNGYENLTEIDLNSQVMSSFPKVQDSQKAAQDIDMLLNDMALSDDDDKKAMSNGYSFFKKYNENILKKAESEAQKLQGNDEKEEVPQPNNDELKKQEENAKKAKETIDNFNKSKKQWVAIMIAMIFENKKNPANLKEDSMDSDILGKLLNALIRDADKQAALEAVNQMGGQIFIEMFNIAKKVSNVVNDYKKKQEKQANFAKDFLDKDKKASENEKLIAMIGTHKNFMKIAEQFDDGI